MDRLETALATMADRGSKPDVDDLIVRLEVELTAQRTAGPAAEPHPTSRRKRGPVVAIAVFLAAVAVAVPLLLLRSPKGQPPVATVTSSVVTSTVPTTPIAPVEPPPLDVVGLPDSLPDLESWSWRPTAGGPASVPVGTVVSQAGRFYASDGDSWWESGDGITWAGGSSVPAEFGAAFFLIQVGDQAWVTTEAEPPGLFRRTASGWVRVVLPGSPERVHLPGRSGNTIVVPGRVAGSPVVWISEDGGDTFVISEAQWGEGLVRAVGKNGESWVAIVENVASGSRTADIWTSTNAASWEFYGPAPFAGQEGASLTVSGSGPFAAVVTTSTPEDLDTLWISIDGIAWTETLQLQQAVEPIDPGTASIFIDGTGITLVGFGTGSREDSVVVLVSADGSSWESVSNEAMFLPIEESGGGSAGWSLSNGTLFVYWDFGDERAMWTGRFGG